MLLCLSQLARMSPDFYDPIRQADALRHVRPPSPGRMTRANRCARGSRGDGIEPDAVTPSPVDVAFVTVKDCGAKQCRQSPVLRSDWSPRPIEETSICEHASAFDASRDGVQLRQLLVHPDASVRARVCNLVGNLCRHSAYFCEALREAHVLAPLIARCGDSDRATRKFACFAIGNAGDALMLPTAGCIGAGFIERQYV